VDGEVASPLTLSLSDLEAMQRVSVEIADREGRRQSFSGVDAALVLTKADAPIRESLKSTDAARYVHAQGGDGYVAVFATAEFDKGRFLIVDPSTARPC
jgi:DMSO/TMAO reductase YedYZ molybdopterin-dependent catalytic subunit